MPNLPVNLDKLDHFYLVSYTTAECLSCDENITTEDWGNIRDIVERCLDHECYAISANNTGV